MTRREGDVKSQSGTWLPWTVNLGLRNLNMNYLLRKQPVACAINSIFQSIKGPHILANLSSPSFDMPTSARVLDMKFSTN